MLFRRHFHGLVCRGWCSLVDAGFSGPGLFVVCEYSSSGSLVSLRGVGWFGLGGKACGVREGVRWYTVGS